MSNRSIITTDTDELVAERAMDARERYDRALGDIARRVGNREISPTEGKNEVEALRAAYEREMGKIYGPRHAGSA